MKKNILFIMAMLAGFTFTSCGNKSADKEAAAADAKPQVKVAKASKQLVPQTEIYTATVESDVKNNISPNAPMRIERILVDVGDMVRKGQVVAILDASNIQQIKLQLDNQKAVYANQQIEFNRIAELYKVGGISKSDYDMAKVQLDGMKAQVDILSTQYRQLSINTQLHAPISGYVTARNYDNGDMYGGQPILTIEQTNPVKLIINVSENYYNRVKRGMPVEITLDAYEGEQFDGKVTIVAPMVNATTHTFPVEITINNGSQKVRPGMFARANLNFGDENNVVVPDLAVVKQIGSGDRYVYVYKNGKVSYNKVELGRHLSDKYEILSGVEDGDQVVVAGQTRLANGVEVNVVK